MRYFFFVNIHVSIFSPTAPGVVSSLSITVVNTSQANVTWSPVPIERANGVIRLYTFSLSEFEGALLTNGTLNTTDRLEASFSGLGK